MKTYQNFSEISFVFRVSGVLLTRKVFFTRQMEIVEIEMLDTSLPQLFLKLVNT